MNKKQLEEKQKTASRMLRKETLRRLDDAQLQRAAGGARLRVPVGFADNTTPIYDDTDG